MVSKDTPDLSLQRSTMDTGPMERHFYALDTDPAHHRIELQASVERIAEPTRTEPQLPAVNRSEISWDTLARINALIQYGKCSIFVKNEGIYKQLVQLHTPAPYLRATIAEVNSMQKSANIEPLLILTLWDNHVETCERVNALIKYGKISCFAVFQEDMYTVLGIHPLVGNDWIEHVTPDEERCHIVKKYYDPLYLKL